jgi:pimeloyl-ACP methyl ester carboxylesterase
MVDETKLRWRRPRPLLFTAGLGLVLAAAVVPNTWAATQDRPISDATARFYQQTPRWGNCEPVNEAVQCADVTVPVDWAKPRGATIDLRVVRSPGTGRGPLLIHPGGPGSSGVDFVSGMAGPLRGMGLQGYDLIGWDSRGTARSAPLACPDKATAAFEKVDGSPDTPAEAKGFEVAATRWAKACRTASGLLFDHMDAGSTARDLDVLRVVTDQVKPAKTRPEQPQKKLNYLGFSYGTLVGGRYAELFPQRDGRMILDSAGHLDHTYRSWLDGVAAAKELTFANYLVDCAGRASCPFRSMSKTAASNWLQGLVRKADHTPLRGGAKTVSQAQLVAVLTGQVSARESWPELDQILAGLRAGDADPLAEAAPEVVWDIQNIATTCQDLPELRNSAQVLRDAARTARTAPLFGVELTAGSPCVRWPAAAPVPPHKLHAPGVAPILVVGVTNDTAGLYRWSQELVAQLGNARLLTFDGIGHFAYLDNECSRDLENAFLLTGVLPPPGKVCAAD